MRRGANEITTERAIGIDVGGTKIAVGAVDATGTILARRTIPTDPRAGFDPAIARLIDAVDATLAETGWHSTDLAGVGIGCPGPFDMESGRIENWYTLPGWDGCNIVSPLAARYDKPVRLSNDADAALRGEALAGAAQGARVAVMLTIGTGIGGAALVDGKIHKGTAGAHPEIGHVPIDPAGPECYCGTHGCLESLAAGPALERAGAPLGYRDARAIFAAAEAGEDRARTIIERGVNAVETATWALIHSFLPELILFGGGIGEDHFPIYRDAARRAIARSTLVPQDAIQVIKAALGNDAGIVGAAALTFDGG
jgi:glucokinase